MVSFRFSELVNEVARITVPGHVYDVRTGLITTIVEPVSPISQPPA